MTWFDWANEELAKWKAASIRSAKPPELSTFTPRAVQILTLARDEALRLNHNFLGTEHILLGLITFGRGVAVNVLKKFCPDLEAIRVEVEKAAPSGPVQKIVGNIPYTPRVRTVIALARTEAKGLSHTYVGTEHLLLGLLAEGGGVAARVLTGRFKMDLPTVRQKILKELDPNYSPGDDKPSA